VRLRAGAPHRGPVAARARPLALPRRPVRAAGPTAHRRPDVLLREPGRPALLRLHLGRVRGAAVAPTRRRPRTWRSVDRLFEQVNAHGYSDVLPGGKRIHPSRGAQFWGCSAPPCGNLVDGRTPARLHGQAARLHTTRAGPRANRRGQLRVVGGPSSARQASRHAPFASWWWCGAAPRVPAGNRQHRQPAAAGVCGR